MDTSKNNYTTANIIDYEELCLQTVYFKSPTIKENILSLEAFTKECKSIADRNGVDYDNYSLIHFLKDLVMTVPFETVFLDILVHMNYSLYKSKFVDNFKDVLINEYMHHMEKLSAAIRTSKELNRKSLSNSLNTSTELDGNGQSTALNISTKLDGNSQSTSLNTSTELDGNSQSTALNISIKLDGNSQSTSLNTSTELDRKFLTATELDGKTLSTSPNISTTVDAKALSNSFQVEIILRKFMKVFQVLKPDPELSYENLVQYEVLAELLNVCYSANVQDSHLVVSLLKLTISRYVNNTSGITHVRQPHYPYGFFKYILKHVTQAKFDLVHYFNDHSKTLWEYARNFSVVYASSFGNTERALCLLQHGFNIFPDSEARHSGHGQPHIKEIMSRTNCMVLQIMSQMRLVNCFTSESPLSPENGYYSTTPGQEECFRLIWRALPDPYVTRSQLALDISTEYFYLALHAIFKPFRHNRNVKHGAMYETCFEDMALGPHEPRTLKHLCRCTIRKQLQYTWNLPNGVFQLGLPKSLVRYLNLESD